MGTTAVTSTQAWPWMPAVMRTPSDSALPQVASRTPTPSRRVADNEVPWARQMIPATASIDSTE